MWNNTPITKTEKGNYLIFLNFPKVKSLKHVLFGSRYFSVIMTIVFTYYIVENF